jgi:hypothetical protein
MFGDSREPHHIAAVTMTGRSASTSIQNDRVEWLIRSSKLETAYDKYSLGVCMLEILLWTPFVVERMGSRGQIEHEICQIFETRRLALGAQGVSVGDGGLPVGYKGNPSKHLQTTPVRLAPSEKTSPVHLSKMTRLMSS